MHSSFMYAAAIGLGSLAYGQVTAPSKPDAPDIKPLSVGDPARPIEIEHWLVGDALSKFEPGKVYVVEFWATWCGPCKASMPHLSELQAKYKDYNVSIIGISDEPLEKVAEFLKSDNKSLSKPWNQIIEYRLTTDPDKSVYNDYHRAAGRSGIPSAFIIGKDSKVEWIGNPHPQAGDGFDKALEAVVKDEWDRDAYKAEFDRRAAADREMDKANAELRTAMAAKDWDKAIKLLDAQIAKVEGMPFLKVQKFQILLKEMNKPDQAYAFGREIMHENWESAMLLNQLAWFVVDAPDIQSRDFDFALEAITRATELTKEKDAAVLDTFARVFYEKGDVKNAVRVQRKAVEVAPNDRMGEEIRATLKKYEDEFSKN